MSVVSKINGFIRRHRNKIFVGGVLITGSIFLTKYAQQRLKEWQDRETNAFIERNRKLNHFESLDRTCNQTVSNLCVALFEVISNTINTDDIIENIRQKPEDKLELWNNLKISLFSKVALTIYSTVMLVVTLKIQLSIIGGYLYKDPNLVSTEMQEKYLSLCQEFLDKSVNKLAGIIKTELTNIVDCLPLTKKLKLSDIEAIYWTIQTSFATHKESPVEQLKDYIIFDEIPNSNDLYNNLLRDTADFLDSDEVKTLTTHCVNCGFILLGDQIAEFYDQKEVETSKQEDTFKNPFEIGKPLVKLLPIINRLLSKQSFPQRLANLLTTNQKLQSLSANIYESLL